MYIAKQEQLRPTFAVPYPLTLDGFSGTPPPPYERSKYKVHSYFFAVIISFPVLNISRFKKKLVWEKCGGGGGGGGCMVGGSSPWPKIMAEKRNSKHFPFVYQRYNV